MYMQVEALVGDRQVYGMTKRGTKSSGPAKRKRKRKPRFGRGHASRVRAIRAQYLTDIISGVLDCWRSVTTASKALLAYLTKALPALSAAHDTILATNV
jgi:hypothetical protein